jgi:Tol biopolymer transport system component/imidazolonepropionase-like amidohydrolase
MPAAQPKREQLEVGMKEQVSWTLCALLVTTGVLSGMAATRTIEFDTRQVTQPDVVVTPDGKTLIFTMLGHLFRLPIEGGSAEQVTFGPYYDSDPAISPDGSRVAFVSDRDGSEGNIFVLDLGSKQVSPLTKESRAGCPAWSPDGQAIAYLSFQPRNPTSASAVVRRISLEGGEALTISSPARYLGSVFYVTDGRLAWTLAERDRKTLRPVTRVEAVDGLGIAATLATLEGVIERVVASPSGDGLYCRRQQEGYPQPDEIIFLSLPGAAERRVLRATGTGYASRPRFSVAPDNKVLYFGQAGRLWKVLLPEGARLPIPLQANVKLEIETPTPPPALAARISSAPRWIMTPRLTPDGKTLIFGAAGFLWRQPLEGGKAERISSGDVYEDCPALSPDGSRLAFVRIQGILPSLMVYDFKTGQTRTVSSGLYYSEPGWSRDGQRLVFGEFGGYGGASGNRIVSVSLADGKKEQLGEPGSWSPRPSFSADGQWMYYTADTSGRGELYRLSLKGKRTPDMLTSLSRHVSDAQVSPDGKWLAFRRNQEIRIAPFGGPPVTDDQARRFSAEGGDSFAFTSDSSALIYSAGDNVWLQPLAAGERRQIPVRLELPRTTPKPLLLRNVRVLDFESGGFRPPASMLIEQGKIAWIGSESGHQVPADTEVIDCTARFAIPGLYDFHAHADGSGHGSSQAAFLAYGVTSVRDPGGRISWLNAMRDRAESTGDPVPRYIFSGDILEGEHPLWGDHFLLVYDEQSAREVVRRFKDWGAAFIKVYPSLPWPLQRSVADEARRLGLPVVAHGTILEQMTKGVILGYFSLEHASSEQVYEDVIQMLSLSGTRWDPTLAVDGADALLLRDEPEKLSDPKFRAVTREQAIEEALTAEKDVDDVTLRGSVADLLARIGAAHRRGVKLYVGTDPQNPACFFGSSLHWELARFVEAGLTPLEVLRIATEEAAKAVGAGDLGTLAPGKIADIVLLSADPLKDIHNTETIWRVIKGGRLYNPDKLSAPSAAGPNGVSK